MQNYLTALCLTFLLFTACQSDDDTTAIAPPSTTLTASSFIPLAVGNYWIYDRYNIDLETGERTLTQQDSIYIDHESIINDETYYFYANGYTNDPDDGMYLRDSLGFLVNIEGNIIVPEATFTDVITGPIRDNLFYIEYQLLEDAIDISVPAGTISSQYYKGNIVPLDDEDERDLEVSYYYNEEIGLVREVVPYWSGLYAIERELVRYSVQ